MQKNKAFTDVTFTSEKNLEFNNNEIVQSKPNFEQLSKMIDEREKRESKSITESIKKPFKIKEKTTSKNKDMER